jgi:arylsulfatase A-like enzyme
LDGQILAKVTLRSREETIIVDTLELSPEPGEKTLKVEYLDEKADRRKLSDCKLYLTQIRVGPPGNGILLKYAEETRQKLDPSGLVISYSALNSTQNRSINKLKKSGMVLGQTSKPEQNQVVPVRLKDSGGRYVTVRASALITGSKIKARVVVAENSSLEFKYGFYQDAVPPDPVDLTVRITDDTGEREFFSTCISLAGIQAGYWHQARLPLNQVTEGFAIIEFSIQGSEAKTGACLIGEPTLLSPSAPDKKTPPNIILVSLDALRADHLSCYGYHRRTSPAIDHIANEGVLFTRADSQSGFTLPSHKSLLTGYYPLVLEYISESADARMRRLPKPVPTLAGYLKEAGYYCVAFTNGGYVGSNLGFHKDFDQFSELPTPGPQEETGDRADKAIGFDKAYDWLSEHRKNLPFFLFLHTCSVHSPYAAPAEYDHLFQPDNKSKLPVTISTNLLARLVTRSQEQDFNIPRRDLEAIIAAYDRGIRWTDDEIKRLYTLLNSLDLLVNTILIITSDHGEEFWEHGRFLHSTMYEELLHVPLIIRFPERFESGVVINCGVELVDLVPTILDMLEKKPPHPLHGRSLLPLLDGRSEKMVERPRFGSRHMCNAAKYGNHKIIMKTAGGKAAFELYNLKMDPLEQRNLFNDNSANSQIKKQMLRLLLYYSAQNFPGLNILLEPKNDIKVYGLKVDGLKLRDDFQYDKRKMAPLENLCRK